MAFLAGETVTAARLNAELGLEWTEYNPTWSTSGTQPSIGNGQLKGEWNRIGDLVRVRISLIAGTTTTFGTNAWSLGLPVTASYDSAFSPWPIWPGSCDMRDVSAFAYYGATAVIEAGGNAVGAIYSSGQVGATGPFTWSATATGGNFDNMSLQVAYKAAA